MSTPRDYVKRGLIAGAAAIAGVSVIGALYSQNVWPNGDRLWDTFEYFPHLFLVLVSAGAWYYSTYCFLKAKGQSGWYALTAVNPLLALFVVLLLPNRNVISVPTKALLGHVGAGRSPFRLRADSKTAITPDA